MLESYSRKDEEEADWLNDRLDVTGVNYQYRKVP